MNEQTPGELYPYRVTFTGRTKAALEKAVMLGGDSETDTINRAIELYALLVEETVLNHKKIAMHDDKPVPVRLVFEHGLPRLRIKSETLDIGK